MRDYQEVARMEGPFPGGSIRVLFDHPACPIIWTHPDHPPHVWRGPSVGFQPIPMKEAPDA